MSFNSSTATYSDIKRKGADFTFTGKLADYSKNDAWTESYKDSIGEQSTNRSFSSMWNTVRVGTEDAGNEIYTKILNYVNDIGNIDTCGLEKLKEYGKILGTTSELLETNIAFPIEIKHLVDILSINRAYLYNKSNTYDKETGENSDTLVLLNTVLHVSTIENLIDSLNDVEKFKSLVHNCIYNTLTMFLNLKNTTFDDSGNGIETKEIWKIDVSRFTNRLWSDDVESDDEVYELKRSLNIDKSFTEKIYADDIIAGNRKLEDFTDSQKIVINKEIERRKKRYGDANSMRYYYMRLYKVLEYFRFCATVYNSVYELEAYDLDENKYTVSSSSSNSNVIKYYNNKYEIDTSLIRKVTEWIMDYILMVSKLRGDMKSQCQRNTMTGTKRLLIDMIRKFILENIDKDVWNTMKSSILKNSSLNKNFDVDVIQYVDTTDYANIENENDSNTSLEHTLRPRFWENYNDLNNSISNDDVLRFFNRINDDGKKFTSNVNDGKFSETNLYEFLSVLFEMGATIDTNSELYLSSEVYTTVNGSELSSVGHETLTDDAKNVIRKFSGDIDTGLAPYANEKNTLHPSYQVLPFMQAFEEYNEAFTGIANIVNSYTENVKESVARLRKRIDKYGNTINFWYHWNDDFSGYTTTRERVGVIDGTDGYVDSPYNFDALTELKNYKEEYINSLSNRTNEYYISPETGKFSLDDEEVNMEVARIKKYYDRIFRNADREIYKYGKDYNGNMYILYKEKGHRNDRGAVGDIWIRLSGHPIAFPLFDISSTNDGFNSTSCLSETDNTKLISILGKIIAFFEEKYGQGRVIPINVGLSYGTYSNTLPITSKTKGTSAEPGFVYTYEDFNVDNNPKLVLSNTPNAGLKGIINTLRDGVIYEAKDIKSLTETKSFSAYEITYYYVDSVTNSIVGTEASNMKVYVENQSGISDVENKVGQLIAPVDSNYFEAEYDNRNNTFEISGFSDYNRCLLFAHFTDENVYEDGNTYYCRDTSISESELHPCTKRKITIHKLFRMNSNALSGNVESGGNVRFGTPDNFYGKSRYVTTEASSSVVDGGLVYENFNAYQYIIGKGQGHASVVDRSTIVFLGGCNPYHMYYNEDDELSLTEAYFNDTQIIEYDAYDFGDNLYRSEIASVFVSSYPLSDCVFKSSYSTDDKQIYTDSFGQFTLRSNPYKKLYPYMSILGHPFEDPSGGDKNYPKGSITIRDKHGNDKTFYYNISSWDNGGVDQHVRVKALKYNRHFTTLNITSTKFNGKFELISTNSSEYPIYLNFNDSGADNLATYSSYSMHQDQRKFFDMGFSYNQKMFYATYYNDSMKYTDSGTILGSFVKSNDDNYNEKLSFFRDTSHNLEYMEPSLMSVSENKSTQVLFHIGDCSSKNGIISAYARKYHPRNENDTSRYIDISIVLVSEKNVFEHKFNIPLRYDLCAFADKESDTKGPFSAKVSCTTNRAYISFVTELPDDDDVICNTIDESSVGFGGSARFGDIKDKCGDSTITIYSFDISDNDNFIFKEDETRYLMRSGTIGYFSQFSGIDGKNNIFANEKLSSDTEFSFELKMNPLSGKSTDINFYSILTSNVTNGSSSEVSEPIGRFINVYPNMLVTSESNETKAYELTGIAVSEGNEYAYAVTASEKGGNCEKFSNFDGKKIYDMSRGIGNGVMFFSDGDDTDTRVGAFYNRTNAKNYEDVNGFKKVKIPVQTSLSGYYSTNFTELEDTASNVYAFCSDRKTIVKTSVRDRGDEFIPLSGIVKFDFSPIGIVETYDELLSMKYVSNGDIYKVVEEHEGYPKNSMYEKTDGGWSYVSRGKVQNHEILRGANTPSTVFTEGYENSSRNGNKRSFALRHGSYITLFGAYGNKTIVIKPLTYTGYGYTYEPIPFFIGNIPFVMEYGGIIKENKIWTVVYNIKKVVVNKDGEVEVNQVYLTDEHGEKTTIPHAILFDYSDPIKEVVDTLAVENEENPETGTKYNYKLICTSRGGTYLYKYNDNNPTITRNFEELIEELHVDRYDMDVSVHDTEEHILISYYVDELFRGGILQTRKNIPDSKASPVTIYDINGKEMTSVRANKIISIKNTVLMEDSDSGLTYISTDDGMTFYVLAESLLNSMSIVGCGNNKFYTRYTNGEKASSIDGFVWKNEIDIPFSNWCIFNANNIDYIACSKFDEDIRNSIVDTDKYVLIESQNVLDGEYDGFKLKGDIIVCYGGTDGKTPIRISRTDSIENKFKTYEFPYSKNFAYNRVNRNDNDLIMPPDGGNFVLIVRDAFDMKREPYVEYVDISATTNGNVNAFGGLETVCGRLVMVPKYGDRMLSYNANTRSFYNFFSFGSNLEFADIDSIDGEYGSDAVITSKYIDSDGKLRFYKTNFENKNYYGIVEIDNGFPMLVTYGKYTTEFRYGKDKYEIYSITFTFMNDVNHKSVTIMSQPVLSNEETQLAYDIIDEEKEKSALYVSGDSSICYNFSTVDDGPRYVIRKIFKKTGSEKSEPDYLSVSYALHSIGDRNSISLDYDLCEGSSGAVSVYKSFDSENKQFFIVLKDIDVSSQSSFIVRIPDEVIERDEHADVNIRVMFSLSSPSSACTIYWGDGEYNDDVETSSEEEIIHEKIVKDGKFHTYNHSYFSAGDFVISIGDGANRFMCGMENSLSDMTKSYVYKNVRFSNSQYLTSAERTFKDCYNMVGDIPAWGSSMTVACSAYMGCTKLFSSTIPNWNDSMTDISDCYNGCYGLGVN